MLDVTIKVHYYQHSFVLKQVISRVTKSCFQANCGNTGQEGKPPLARRSLARHVVNHRAFLSRADKALSPPDRNPVNVCNFTSFS